MAGYDVKDHTLVINAAEAATVQMIFERVVALCFATTFAKALIAEGVRTKRGRPIDKGFLYKLLNNRSISVRWSTRGMSCRIESEGVLPAIYRPFRVRLQSKARLSMKNPARRRGCCAVGGGRVAVPSDTGNALAQLRHACRASLLGRRTSTPLCDTPRHVPPHPPTLDP
jgi:site-specific DNA recombinase